MTNVLADSAAWLTSMRKSHAGVTVTYKRGLQSVALTVSKSECAIELDRGDAGSLQTTRTDWVVAVGDLILGGSVVEPAEGDLIEHNDGTTTRTYEVMPIGTESHYQALDAYGEAWLIHSRLVQSA